MTKINRSNYRYGIKNISGWEAKSQRKKWNFQRCRKTLTTKTQRHEVLVKRLRMRMVISHWSLVISKEAKAEKRRKEAGRQEAGDRRQETVSRKLVWLSVIWDLGFGIFLI